MAEAEKQVKVKTIHAIQHDAGKHIPIGSIVKAPKSVTDIWIAAGAAALHVEGAAEAAPTETAEQKEARVKAEAEAAARGGQQPK